MDRKRSNEIRWAPWLGLFMLCVNGCTNYITPPAYVSDPQAVFILDFGRHSSLLLPNEANDEFTEFAYGEWQWYALQRDSFIRIFPTMLWPTQGTLGRNTWVLDEPAPGGRDEAGLVMDLLGVVDEHFYPQAVHPVFVERRAISALHELLDERFESSDVEPLSVPEYRLYFVTDARRYTLFHNCNHETVDWLVQLGCDLNGSGMISDFVVRKREGEESSAVDDVKGEEQ